MIWNREAETMSRGARERLQLERLQEAIRWAVARVAFHRDRLGTARLQGLPDLAALPFVRKADLREQYPFGLLAVPRAELARIHASSGTCSTSPSATGSSRAGSASTTAPSASA